MMHERTKSTGAEGVDGMVSTDSPRMIHERTRILAQKRTLMYPLDFLKMIYEVISDTSAGNWY